MSTVATARVHSRDTKSHKRGYGALRCDLQDVIN